MKMIKKARIVNLSLSSSKNYSPTIHYSHEHVNDFFLTQNQKQQHIMDKCYEAIKIIDDEKHKVTVNERKTRTVDSYRQVKKDDK